MFSENGTSSRPHNPHYAGATVVTRDRVILNIVLISLLEKSNGNNTLLSVCPSVDLHSLYVDADLSSVDHSIKDFKVDQLHWLSGRKRVPGTWPDLGGPGPF